MSAEIHRSWRPLVKNLVKNATTSNSDDALRTKPAPVAPPKAPTQNLVLLCVLQRHAQPIEDGHVSLARARSVVTFPAEFMLVAARKLCPCVR